MKSNKLGLLPIISMALLFTLLLAAYACKNKEESVDCSTVTGATFSSNSGKIASILETKCAATGCHAAGGDGAQHWEWVANYDTIQPHFEHMLEAIEGGEMPEAGSTELTTEEKDQLECWKNAGYPK